MGFDRGLLGFRVQKPPRQPPGKGYSTPCQSGTLPEQCYNPSEKSEVDG
jgi:hypothetical protein